MGRRRRPSMRLASGARWSCVLLLACGAAEAPNARAPHGEFDETSESAEALPPATNPDRMGQMTPAQSLVEMTLAFMEPGFSRADAERMLGPVTQGEEPGTLTIDPRESYLTRALVEVAESDDGPLLTMLFMQYEDPFEVDTSVLESRFGTSRELPRLKPDQPTPLVFDVETDRFAGMLMLHVDRSSPGPVRNASAIRLTRLPREEEPGS